MHGTRSSMDYIQSNLPKYISFPFLVCKIYITKDCTFLCEHICLIVKLNGENAELSFTNLTRVEMR
jgi:hypothetical protein